MRNSMAPSDPYFEILSQQNDVPLMHALRKSDPVHFVPSQQLWFVCSHAAVKALYNDDANVTQDARAWSLFKYRAQGAAGSFFEESGLGGLDPKGHQRLRSLFIKAFTAKAVKRMEHQIHDVIRRYADPLRARYGDVIDLINDFTKPIPTVVVARIMGVPLGDDERHFCLLAHQIFLGFFPFQPPHVLAAATAAFAELSDWVMKLAVERARSPQEDLISSLMDVRDGGDQLEPQDVVRLITALLAAGTETTARGGQVVLDVLLNHPEHLLPVRRDLRLIPKAVSEILRWGFDGSDFIVRYASKDFELNSKRIRQGQILMLSVGGACRDPEVFNNPDVFDLERDQSNSLVFGYGAHYCIGAQLARLELASMLQALMAIVSETSKLREDLVRYENPTTMKRRASFPVEIVRD